VNKQIQELAEQAKISVPAWLPVTEWIAEYNQIFAELIVRECVDNLFLHGYDDAANQVTKHFGVE
jgi:hypothetical protein